MKKILVTGCAGFIGYHVCEGLLSNELEVIGIDNLNAYYDVRLKQARLERLNIKTNFTYHHLNIQDCKTLSEISQKHHPDCVVHLAAQAGVRHSIKDPQACISSNIIGFANILECCRQGQFKHLIYASSSSVYGLNSEIPSSSLDQVDHPISLYAATKKSNELMAHSYSHLYGIPTTGLRFFTVYGPWGRPDMAYFLFADKIMRGIPIQIFNYGKMKRDFTYIDDITEGIMRTVGRPPEPDVHWDGKANGSSAAYKIYNIGNSAPVKLLYLIKLLEKTLGKNAIKEMTEMQRGDVTETYADIDDLVNDVGFSPKTTIEEGIAHFSNWFKWYYNH